MKKVIVIYTCSGVQSSWVLDNYTSNGQALADLSMLFDVPVSELKILDTCEVDMIGGMV